MRKLFIIFAAIIISGCSYSEKNPLSQTERTCRGLKRSIIFNETSKFNEVGSMASATERAEALKLYDKYNCSSFEKKK